MDSDPYGNVGCTDLSGKLGSVLFPRETDPTPAVTRPGAGPSSAMVTRSRARGDRGMSVQPEIEFRQEVEFRHQKYRQKLVWEVWGRLDQLTTPLVSTRPLINRK